MSWPEKYLNELGFVGRGKSKHRPRNDSVLYGGDFPFIQTGDVKNAQLYVDKYSVTYNDIGLAQSKLWPVNTLCITIAANIADTAILDFEACFPDSIIGFVANPKLANVFFVKYFYTTFQKNLQLISQGAAQDNLNLEKLLTYPIPCPPIEVQNKIASTLTHYDDLIQTNQQRITLLEEAAQRLYDEWFVKLRFPNHEQVSVVDGVPNGWERTKVGKRIPFKYGKALKATDRKEGKYPVYGSSGVVGTHCDFFVDKYAVIIGRKGNVGSVFFSSEQSNPIDTVFFIEPDIHNIYYYHVLQSLPFVDSDSAVPGLSRESAHSLDIMIPSADILEKFVLIVNRYFEQCHLLTQQNHKLTQARNELIPRLMSGQLDVSKLTLAKVV